MRGRGLAGPRVHARYQLPILGPKSFKDFRIDYDLCQCHTLLIRVLMDYGRNLKRVPSHVGSVKSG